MGVLYNNKSQTCAGWSCWGWTITKVQMEGDVEIGMFLLMVSALFYFLGMVLLFRRSLILMSNVRAW